MTWLFVTLKAMSPQIADAFKDGIKKILDDLAEKAKATPNKWDDMGDAMMRKVFKVED